MNNLNLYCISINPDDFNLISKVGYLPVGLGKKEFSNLWLHDRKGENISEKNPFYGEYTFHYYLWKNDVLDIEKWIGFCQYRKFWVNEKTESTHLSFADFQKKILKFVPESLSKYESIIGEELFINQFRFSKFAKKNLKKLIFNPKLLFNKKYRNIKFHFDLMHGEGNLDRAISVLEKKEQSDFRDFVNKEVSFNPHNMFICKNKKILFNYYESVFPWLYNCEKIFGFSNLKGYGLKRIYGFLAERYMSYWFKKYTKFFLMPILFKDIKDFR